MSDLHAKADTLCAYPISGQYGLAPRILYYVLVATIVLIRRHEWLASVSAAYIMTYSGNAAIHAIILCAIRASSTSLLSDSHVELGKGPSAWVRGRVLDWDTDATLAIVGVGFLMLLPLAVYSITFRKSEAKPILAAWGVLMLIGFLCCLVTLWTVDTTHDGPFYQTRFCSSGYNNSIISTPGISFSVGINWNTTVHDYFLHPLSSVQGCFYPCMYSSQILRSESEIVVVPFPDPQQGSRGYWAFRILGAFAWACIPLYIVGALILLLHQLTTAQPRQGAPAVQSIKERLAELQQRPMTFWVFLKVIFISFQIYSLVFAPVALIIFVAFAEYSISVDSEAESFRHVGQWQPIVSVGLVVIAALLNKHKMKLEIFHLRAGNATTP